MFSASDVRFVAQGPRPQAARLRARQHCPDVFLQKIALTAIVCLLVAGRSCESLCVKMARNNAQASQLDPYIKPKPGQKVRNQAFAAV